MEWADRLARADRIDAGGLVVGRCVEPFEGVSGTRDRHLVAFHHLEVRADLGPSIDLDPVHTGSLDSRAECVVRRRSDVSAHRRDPFADRLAVEIDDLRPEFVGSVGDELGGVGQAERQPDLAGHEDIGRVALDDGVGPLGLAASAVAVAAAACCGDTRRCSAEEEGSSIQAETGRW